MIKHTAITFTIIGILLLAQALRPAYIICKREQSWGWRSLVILICVYVLGYGVMAAGLYQSTQINALDLLVASILLGGSIFVVLVMEFSLRSINKIRDITRQEHHLALTNERNHKLLERLPRAVADQEFELYYQPLIATKNNSIEGVECLIRWPQTDGSFVTATNFITLAEHSGVIVDITRWVIRTSLQQMGKWHLSDHKLTLQINISARDLEEPGLVNYIEQHIQKNHIDPNYITLEITENLIISEQINACSILQQLRSLGIGVSLDDFGTGYSSMTLLNQLPLSQIKIDRSFVHGIEHNKKHMVIVKSTLDLAKKMGLEVVAEGVENAKQVELLKQMNCQLMQGYYLAKPMPVGTLEQWLKSNAFVTPAPRT
jgi:EAL domain-containing protein (putative c-di-GMP-specific phosphodiesterase class I)